MERRAGSWNGTNFVEHPGGSLIQDRSLYPSLQELVLPGNNVIAFRASLSILGLGFVEAIDSNTIAAIAQSQSLSVRGQVIEVPVFEAGGATRVGRFGWKNQQASLLSHHQRRPRSVRRLHAGDQGAAARHHDCRDARLAAR